MNRLVSRSQLVWVSLTLLGLCALYLPGLHSELVFDDVPLLEKRALWSDYGSLLDFKARLLSYGSFVWIESLFGPGWWKQRLVNLVLHGAVVLALYSFYKLLVARVEWPEDAAAPQGAETSRLAALRLGLIVFAFNPVAVYAVAYLIQRSILGATLFAVLACLGFAKGVLSGRALWFGAAAVGYVVAVLCKEHALMVPVLWVPLYAFLKRPAPRRLAFIVVGCAAVLGSIAAALFVIYGEIIGVPFDELSRIYLDQLKEIDPGIGPRLWGLSILNQAALFFYYGLLWFLPNVSWMSIDMRPPFPVSYLSWSHLAGAILYVGAVVGACWLVIRRSGPAGFAGLCVSMPLLLFGTEFLVVWIQDPFVLYRSYLWAIGVPGLVMLLFVGMRPATIYAIAVVVALAFGALALERVLSLQHKLSVWSDAVEKVDTKAAVSAVGRWRPYLNRGTYYLENMMAELAYKDFERAVELGEARGHSNYNMGISLQLMGRYEQAVEQFDLAEKRGTTKMASLFVNRAESRLALGRPERAYEDLSRALTFPLDKEVRDRARTRLAEVALGTGKYQVARTTYAALVADSPGNYDFRLGQALADVGLGNDTAALAQLGGLLAERDSPSARYGRALVLRKLGRMRDALSDAERAVRLDPRNSVFRDLQGQIAAQVDKIATEGDESR